MRTLLAFVLKTLHGALVILSVTGGYFLPIEYLPAYLLLAPWITVDGRDFDRSCSLTVVTHWADKGCCDSPKEGFIQATLRDAGVDTSASKLYSYNDWLMYTSWLAAFLRLMAAKNVTVLANQNITVIVTCSILLWIIVFVMSKTRTETGG